MLKSSFTVMLRDFNVRPRFLWVDGISSYEGSHLESQTTLNGFKQLISGPTHLLSNSFYVLTSIDQQNPAVDSDAHANLHDNCRHHITYTEWLNTLL